MQFLQISSVLCCTPYGNLFDYFRGKSLHDYLKDNYRFRSATWN